MLRNVIGERARDCILQKPFVRDQAVAVDGFHLCRVKIHRHDADQYEHTEDHVQNGQTRWRWQFYRQVALCGAFRPSQKFRPIP